MAIDPRGSTPVEEGREPWYEETETESEDDGPPMTRRFADGHLEGQAKASQRRPRLSNSISEELSPDPCALQSLGEAPLHIEVKDDFHSTLGLDLPGEGSSPSDTKKDDANQESENFLGASQGHRAAQNGEKKCYVQ
eukprot:TRINITY_DN30189_c0_g1_i1.p1 TRINITY_DN30189_c0_g1~~TRINITY_DN30189_c0_g1_i1.p1  ORF type:complete len:154 (+),score=27.15 TRINITY_DN30189_c0_g1_i1:52-462(+)